MRTNYFPKSTESYPFGKKINNFSSKILLQQTKILYVELKVPKNYISRVPYNSNFSGHKRFNQPLKGRADMKCPLKFPNKSAEICIYLNRVRNISHRFVNAEYYWKNKKYYYI